MPHLVSTNQKNNEKWIELFESYDYMSQDGEGANNINMGAQGDVVNEPDAEKKYSCDTLIFSGTFLCNGFFQ